MSGRAAEARAALGGLGGGLGRRLVGTPQVCSARGRAVGTRVDEGAAHLVRVRAIALG